VRQNNLQRIILLVYALFPARFLTAATLDNQRVGYTSNQERIWRSDGNLESVIAYIFFSLILLIALDQVRRNWHSLTFSPLISFTFFAFSISIVFNLANWQKTDVAGILVFFLILMLSDKASTDTTLFVNLKKLHLMILTLIVLFPIFKFEMAFALCTNEKCSPLGNIFTSFFPHENALGLFLFCGSILFLVDINKHSLTILLIHGFLILMTASKLAISIYLFVLLYRILKARYLLLFVWLLLFGSLGIFMFLTDPESLTGRGQIFSIGRNLFLQNWIFGNGIDALHDAYFLKNEIGYRVYHEHNGIGAILVRFGIVGLLGLIAFLFHIRRTLKGQISTQSLLLLGIFLTFPTESYSSFSLQNFLSWIYLVAVVNVSHTKI